MRFKSLFKIFLVVFLLGTLVYIFSGIKGKNRPNYVVELSADGKEMTHTHYNDENKIDLVIKCSESNKESADKVVMKEINGLIPKKGRMNKDIKVFGERGYAENNFHNFFVENNARLLSEDFIITSDNFTLKNREELHSAPSVYYQTKTLKGTASRGMEYFLNANTLKFHKAKGTYKRNNQVFSFQTDFLWLMEKEKTIVMEKKVVIKDDKSILRSGWLTLRFSEDLKQVTEAASQKNSYFYSENPEKKESKEIKSIYLTSTYDNEGHLTQLKAMQEAKILLKSEAHQTLITGALIQMDFDGPTGKATEVKIPMRGVIENTGKTRFKVLADQIDVQYNKKGEIRFCEGKGNVEFIVEDYKGISNKIFYDIEKGTIGFDGERSNILQQNNTFTSSQFRVNVKRKILSSGAGVKSLIRLDQTNALFSLDPIYIDSGKFSLFEKEKKFAYERQVNLNQGDTRLTARSLEIEKDNSILAEGNASLSFRRGDKEVTIKGDRLTFTPEKKQIDIVENAVIKSGESILRANRFEVHFSDDNEIEDISGESEVYFSKEDLSGTSRRARWLFNQEILILNGSPQVANKNGGKTSGKELRINLKTNKIMILSALSDRTETIIK
jgi:lipopolysaccharide transport protein LptA